MTISFVSVQGNKSYGWDVVKKTFPTISGGSTVLAVTTVFMDKHCKRQKDAEVAAKKIATSKELSYVSENASIITVAPFFGSYLPCEVTSSGGFIGQATASSIQSAIEKARSIAESRDMLFLLP